jgi:hypothetical protein
MTGMMAPFCATVTGESWPASSHKRLACLMLPQMRTEQNNGQSLPENA